MYVTRVRNEPTYAVRIGIQNYNFLQFDGWKTITREMLLVHFMFQHTLAQR